MGIYPNAHLLRSLLTVCGAEWQSVLESQPLPERPEHPGSVGCKEPKTVFFVDALLPENRNQILGQNLLSANLSASKCFSVREQTNSNLPFQSSGIFSPKIRFQVLKSHIHIMDPFTILKKLVEVNLVVFVNISKISFMVYFILALFCIQSKREGFWKQLQPMMLFSEKETEAQKGKESSSRSHSRAYLIRLGL